MKFSLYLLSLLLFLGSCKNPNKDTSKFRVVKDKNKIYKYEMAYEDTANLKPQIDSIINIYYKVFDAYNSSSLVYKFNHNLSLNKADIDLYEQYSSTFKSLDSITSIVRQISGSAVNPALGGLYNYWHLYIKDNKQEAIDTALIHQLKKSDYGSLVQFMNGTPVKNHIDQLINYNAFINCLALDAISHWLDSGKHIKNYYLNLGGDIIVKGNNGKESYWPIIIEKPYLNSLKFEEYCKIPAKNFSIGGENSYQNYFINNGVRYSHTINPLTGSPTKTDILKVYILSNNIIYSKALSLACLVLESEQSIRILELNSNIKAFILYEKNGQLKHWNTVSLPIELPSKGKK